MSLVHSKNVIYLCRVWEIGSKNLHCMQKCCLLFSGAPEEGLEVSQVLVQSLPGQEK